MVSPDHKSTSLVDCIIHGLISIAIWVSSLTMMLPIVLLLKYNKTIQHKVFSHVFVKFLGPYFGKEHIVLRKATFDILKDKLGERKGKKQLKVLELGIGAGANFMYYPEGSSLVAVDMNPHFEGSLRKTLEEYPDVKLERIVHAMAEDMYGVEDDSIDVVISTLVLCSTVDASMVLKESRRVLKPGGVFLFLEHIVFPNNQCAKIVQMIISPLWSIFFAGCRVDRDTISKIKSNGFSELDLRVKEVSKLPLFVRPITYGIAIK